MRANKLTKIVRYNGGLSHHVENVVMYYNHHSTRITINWLSYRINNKKIIKFLDKKIINNFKGLFEEYKLESKPFIDIGYFKKWVKYKEVVEPLIKKIQEIEKQKKTSLTSGVEMSKKEWKGEWTKFLIELEKWFIDYYTDHIIEICEYEKGFPNYRQKNIDRLTSEFKLR